MKSKGDHKISLLEKYGYTEQMAKELCHHGLWNALLGLEDRKSLIAPIWNTLTNTSIHQWESRFRDEAAQMTPEEWVRILESGDSAA